MKQFQIVAQSSPWRGTVVFGTTHPPCPCVSMRSNLPDLPLSIVLSFILSAVCIAEPFQFPSLRSELPDNVVSASSIDSFRHQLRTFLVVGVASVVSTLVYIFFLYFTKNITLCSVRHSVRNRKGLSG